MSGTLVDEVRQMAHNLDSIVGLDMSTRLGCDLWPSSRRRNLEVGFVVSEGGHEGIEVDKQSS